MNTLKKSSLAIGAHATSLAVVAILYFNVSFTTNEEEKAQNASSPLKVAEHMLEQNDTLERMVILLDAIIERVSANDSRVADEYPKGQPIDPGYPAHTQFHFFAKRITFQNNGSLFLLECCLCVSLQSTTEGGSF